MEGGLGFPRAESKGSEAARLRLQVPGDLLTVSEHGLECPLGGFHIDPWGSVPLAVVTHAHGDHARPGSQRYIAAARGIGLLRRRLGPDAVIEGMEYGERRRLGNVMVSLHPAGHVLGSAQIRVESADTVWVASGDYKRQPDPTAEALEPLRCHVFITEATFALPIYRWEAPTTTVAEIWSWWQQNASAGKASLLFCYALGKAQRILAELLRYTEQEVLVHGAIEHLVDEYRRAGVRLLPTRRVTDEPLDVAGNRRRRAERRSYAGELIIAPPSAAGSPWVRRFGPKAAADTAFASGWMRVRGIRRRRGYDRGFVMSDHADWDDLLRTIAETGAQRVLTTHGYADILARHLRSQGQEAQALTTPFGAEEDD